MNRPKNIVAPFVVFTVLCYLFWNLRDLPWTPLRMIGVFLLIPSFLLVVLARVQLGGSFSVSPQARQLVTRGLYSKFRNPIYVFSSIFVAGLFLAIGRPVFALILLVVVPVQILRARKEAAVLEAHFGDAYREYHKSTWF